jgi:hypothetical protein
MFTVGVFSKPEARAVELRADRGAWSRTRQRLGGRACELVGDERVRGLHVAMLAGFAESPLLAIISGYSLNTARKGYLWATFASAQ